MVFNAAADDEVRDDSWCVTLTLHVYLDLCLSAFDVEPVVGRRLAAVHPRHVAADVPQPQTSVGCLHHCLPTRHQQVLLYPGPEHGRTRFPIHHLADQLSVAALSHTDHLCAKWN